MRQKTERLFLDLRNFMFVKSLSLKNFRNYTAENFEFSEGVNVVVGRNAQGKTNCAEAAFLLATGFSPRVTKDKHHKQLCSLASQLQYTKRKGV